MTTSKPDCKTVFKTVSMINKEISTYTPLIFENHREQAIARKHRLDTTIKKYCEMYGMNEKRIRSIGAWIKR